MRRSRIQGRAHDLLYSLPASQVRGCASLGRSTAGARHRCIARQSVGDCLRTRVHSAAKLPVVPNCHRRAEVPAMVRAEEGAPRVAPPAVSRAAAPGVTGAASVRADADPRAPRLDASGGCCDGPRGCVRGRSGVGRRSGTRRGRGGRRRRGVRGRQPRRWSLRCGRWSLRRGIVLARYAHGSGLSCRYDPAPLNTPGFDVAAMGGRPAFWLARRFACLLANSTC